MEEENTQGMTPLQEQYLNNQQGTGDDGPGEGTKPTGEDQPWDNGGHGRDVVTMGRDAEGSQTGGDGRLGEGDQHGNMGRRETRREEPVRRGRPGEREIASGNGQFPRGGRAEEPREPQGEAQNSHPSREENPVTHDHSRGIGRGGAYQPQRGEGGRSGGTNRSRVDVQASYGGARGEGRGRQGGPEGDRLMMERQNQRTMGQTITTNRRNGLNPNAPPFNPEHTQQQRSQQPWNTPRTQNQTNKDRINTLFQTGLLRPTESPLLNDDEWTTFCNKLDELTRTIAELCNNDRQHNRRDNNSRNGQRGWRQREATHPGRRPNRISGRERRIREMADIQKLYRRNPKQAMQQIKQEAPPLRCQIPCQVVQDHFEELGRPTPDFDNPGPPPFGSWPATTDGDVMERELTRQEVKNVVKRMPYQSAPGPDHVTYANWREVDPTSAIITNILNTCRRNRKVPDSGKLHYHPYPQGRTRRTSKTGAQSACKIPSINYTLQ